MFLGVCGLCMWMRGDKYDYLLDSCTMIVFMFRWPVVVVTEHWGAYKSI